MLCAQLSTQVWLYDGGSELHACRSAQGQLTPPVRCAYAFAALAKVLSTTATQFLELDAA
jgi:hypothetical protein